MYRRNLIMGHDVRHYAYLTFTDLGTLLVYGYLT
jgi:hypothetical protein